MRSITPRRPPSPLTTGMIDKRPLHGKTVLITRAAAQSAEFEAGLRARGAEVINCPTIEIRPPSRWKEVDRVIEDLENYDWIIFTSANGVQFFFQRLDRKTGRARLPSGLRVCAIGPATAHALQEKGVSVHFMPEKFVAESILEGFEKRAVRGKRFLLARAKEARDVLPKGLEQRGGVVDVVEVYRTVRPRGVRGRLKTHLDRGIDVIAFTSSSTVNHFVEFFEPKDLKNLLAGVEIACIGPVTAETARQKGLAVRIQPAEYTIPALTDAIVRHLQSTQHLRSH
jgi:uroporphyrinogen III methyltransferase / synthase